MFISQIVFKIIIASGIVYSLPTPQLVLRLEQSDIAKIEASNPPGGAEEPVNTENTGDVEATTNTTEAAGAAESIETPDANAGVDGNAAGGVVVAVGQDAAIQQILDSLQAIQAQVLALSAGAAANLPPVVGADGEIVVEGEVDPNATATATDDAGAAAESTETPEVEADAGANQNAQEGKRGKKKGMKGGKKQSEEEAAASATEAAQAN